MKSVRMPPDLDAQVEAHRIKTSQSYGAAMLDLMRLGYASTQPKPKAPPTPAAKVKGEPKRTVPDSTPSWMRRGFETGVWK